MHKKYIIALVVLAIVGCLAALPSFAWQPVRTGQKNFERAWSAYSFKRHEKALEYFAKAADGYSEALKQYPPSRTMVFPSNLTMAGMSFYYSGRYQECIDTMDKVAYKEKKIWEAHFYSALSQARMDNKDETIKFLKAFIQSSPMQSRIANAVTKQLTELETNSTTPEKAADALDDAAFKQFNYNRQFVGHNISNVQDQCNGAFWWRNNRSPCSDSQFPNRDN